MKSRASIKDHPIHPIIVGFPIAFFLGTWLFDVIGLFANDNMVMIPAFYMNIGGIAFALLAAVPGLIDYTHTVPPNSSAKKRAAKHGLINVSVVLLFGIALYLRVSPNVSLNNDFFIIGIETIAMLLLSIAGWLGGTLVYRNQIGVDIRYAHAGKWKEEYVDERNGLVEVHDVYGLKSNQMRLIHVGDKRIVVARTDNRFVAFDDHCTHRGGSLAGGSMACGIVQCPWHGSQFDVNTGEIKAGPAKHPIVTYPILEENGKMYIRLSPAVEIE
jgi:uncharacterized membrane protein/nitrite reductase/ring-hydroxylating ferredoxin subunit